MTTLGHDVDLPWRKLPKKLRHWLLFTDEQPVVPVYPRLNREQVRQAIARGEPPDYMGTFTGARRYVMETFAKTESASMKKRVARYMVGNECPECHGRRLNAAALSVTFAGMDIASLSHLSLKSLADVVAPYSSPDHAGLEKLAAIHPEKAIVTRRIAEDVASRLEVVLELGLGYLTLDRSTPTLSPGELQRLRLATQVRSNLFGVVYVLDEPSAGLHPADTAALLVTMQRLKDAGNSLFVVEHDPEVVRRADWIVDVGPGAGEKGGRILYSGPVPGLEKIEASETRIHLFNRSAPPDRKPRVPRRWLRLRGVTCNNVRDLDVSFPLGVFTTVTGVSGSGKSSLVSQALIRLVLSHFGEQVAVVEEAGEEPQAAEISHCTGEIIEGMDTVRRLVQVDQKSIGRTPRSNLATYTGLFDHIRKVFASTAMARKRRYGPGRFSFNVAKGRCETCQGEGWVFVELLFLPGVYAPCPACHGARYNPQTLEILHSGKNIADVLSLTVDDAAVFFAGEPAISRILDILQRVGLGYLRLGQPATELSGGEAQRIKLATELHRKPRGHTLYVLDEPTTGLHPSDVETLMDLLQGLVSAGHTVVAVEHDMRVAAASDWIIDMGPGAGENGGRVMAAAAPEDVCGVADSITARYLKNVMAGSYHQSSTKGD